MHFSNIELIYTRDSGGNPQDKGENPYKYMNTFIVVGGVCVALAVLMTALLGGYVWYETQALPGG